MSRILRHTGLIFLCTLVMAFSPKANDGEVDGHLEVALRTIGHEVLLAHGDSTSRVMPIEKEENRYKISFESSMAINPDALAAIVDKVVESSEIAQSYIVQVEDCEDGSVVYSYEKMPAPEDGMMPCRSRSLPKDCYVVYLTLTDGVIPDNGAETTSAQLPNTLFDASNTALFLFLTFFLFLSLGLWYVQKNRLVQADHPDRYSIGTYVFDKRRMLLIHNDQQVELTGKEADLLDLLHSSANQTIERDAILNRVWGDEGDYVGRTLDVFISRLRKKLEDDPTIKIANIRGVGYRLVMDV